MNDIHDIRPPIEMLPLWEKCLPILFAIGAIALLYLIYKVYNRTVCGGIAKETELQERLTPYEYALRQLDEARGYMGEGEDKQLAQVLSDALREYLERAYDMPANEETTEEFLHDVTSRHLFPVKMIDGLTRFLELCDVAKFARRAFAPEDREHLHKSARTFLDYAQKELEARTPEPRKKGGKR